MSEDNVSASHVAKALSFLVSSSMATYVDNDGYVRYESTASKSADGEDEKVTTGREKPLPIVVFGYGAAPKPDEAHLLNPFSDGAKDSPATAWFYLTLRLSALGRVKEVLQRIVADAAIQKGADYRDVHIYKHLKEPPVITEFKPVTVILATKIPELKGKTVYDEVDAEMVREIHQMVSAARDDFLRIDYVVRHQLVNLSLPLITEEQEAKILDLVPNIRKKTVYTVRTILRALLKAPDGDLSAYTTENQPGVPAKLFCVLSTLYKLYSRINQIVEWSSPTAIVNLDAWDQHISKLPAYNNNARWARPVQSVPPAQAAMQTQPIPTTTPTMPTVTGQQQPFIQQQPSNVVTVPSVMGGYVQTVTNTMPMVGGGFGQPPVNPYPQQAGMVSPMMMGQGMMMNNGFMAAPQQFMPQPQWVVPGGNIQTSPAVPGWMTPNLYR